MDARWIRGMWLAAGWLALAVGLIGIVLPLLPTVPFVLLAGYCFSRGSRRWERWLLQHRHLGPPLRDWRAHRAVPLRAKQLATLMMAISSTGAAILLPAKIGWIPGACCLAVAIWLWRLPTRPPAAQPTQSP